MTFQFKRKSTFTVDSITGMKPSGIEGNPAFWERQRMIKARAQEFDRKNPIGAVQQRMNRAIEFKQQSDLSSFDLALQDVVRKWRGV